MTGTAIRLPGSDGASWPTLTDVSVQDYWRLRSGGHEPAGLLATTSVWFASPPRATRLRRKRQMAQNQELEEMSRAFNAVRIRPAPGCSGRCADAHCAVGAVGVEFSHLVHEDKLAVASAFTETRLGWHIGRLGIPYRITGRTDIERPGWVITMHAAGTAIRQSSGAPPPPPRTQMHL